MVASHLESAAAHSRKEGNPLKRGKRRATLAKCVAVSLAAATVGFCTLGTAGAQTPEQAPDRKQAEIIDFTFHNEQYADNDLAPSGPSLGDMNSYSGSLVKDGRTIGRGGGTCQGVHLDGAKMTMQCLVTLDLERGSLTMQSLAVKGAKTVEMAITGGTGAYNTARGTVQWWDIGAPVETVRATILR
ncbi:allene oxide cyclase barrel-like domain-containing protein [Streptomyces buecherae]|uniref:allene oxide cyclase barrel-like domain-containing protein n=1 Tax=Streptomyces buecherae TaxID=2763006 RepID=UPI0036567265